MDDPERGTFVSAMATFGVSSVVEVETVDQQSQQEQRPDAHSEVPEAESWPESDGDRAPCPKRLRVVLLLSLLSWAVVILVAVAVIWGVSRF